MERQQSIIDQRKKSILEDKPKGESYTNAKSNAILNAKNPIEKENLILENEDELDNFDLNKVRITNKVSLFFIHFYALTLKRVRYFRRDLRGLVCEVFLPCSVVVVGLAILMINFVFEAPSLLITPSMYDNPIKSSISSNSGLSNQATTQNILNKFDSQYWDISYDDVTDVQEWDNKQFS
jgi:ATP-binding cassette subfamily A (ABC1) protein 3